MNMNMDLDDDFWAGPKNDSPKSNCSNTSNKSGTGSQDDEAFFQKLEHDSVQAMEKSKEELEALVADKPGGGKQGVVADEPGGGKKGVVAYETGGGTKRSWGDAKNFQSTLDVVPLIKEMPKAVRDQLMSYQTDDQRIKVVKAYMEHFLKMLSEEDKAGILKLPIKDQFIALKNGLADGFARDNPTWTTDELRMSVNQLLHKFEFPLTIAGIFERKNTGGRRSTRNSGGGA
jgi:hypothetical protein